MKYLFYLMILLQLSCTKGSHNTEVPETTTLQRKHDSVITLIGKVGARDRYCLNEIERAKKDLKDSAISHTYYLYPDNVTGYGYGIEMQKFLKPYGLKCKSGYNRETCIPLVHHRGMCYFDYLKAVLDKKFKPGFLDSLKTVAIKHYIDKNPDEIYYVEFSDKKIIYAKGKSYKTQFDDLHKDFIKQLKYPKKFVFNKDGKPNWETNGGGVTIFKNGMIKSSYKTIIFANSANDKFEQYFVEQINHFIKNSHWNIVTVEGIPINSYNSIWFNDLQIVNYQSLDISDKN